MNALQVDGMRRRFALFMAEDGTALLGDIVSFPDPQTPHK